MFFMLERHYEIGTINFMEIFLEQNIDSVKYFPVFKNSFKGKCIIEIYGDEGSFMPHFHITSNDGKFSCCVCLFDNMFFNHGTHQSILHKKDWKVLDEWMRKPNHKDPNITNWQFAKQLWIYHNGSDYKNNKDFVDDATQPDYATIKSYK